MTVVVVGGGPAGMMAAINAAANGNKVTLVEKNEKLGKKLFLTGKGRCNLTNACPVEELFDNIVTNPKFCYSAVYGFTNTDTVAFFEEAGLKTKVERGGRVFPASDKSSDVISTLKKRLKAYSVNILLGTKAVKILTDVNDSTVTGVIVNDGSNEHTIKADAVIMATGGCSYPLTGSDGSSFSLLEELGIELKEPEPSLVPFVCRDELIRSLQGLSLKNVSVTVMCRGKEIYKGFGEMLFTHFGLSGPLILTASCYIHRKDYSSGIKVITDLKPALSDKELDERILRDFGQNLNRNFGNSLGKLLPSKIITAVIKRSGIDPDKKVNLITKEERQRLLKVIKNFEADVHSNRGFDEAIITRGGVSTKEIDPKNMQSKKIKGLFFAGEMIDTDALTGGFNLQIAWSTGYLASKSV